MTKQPLRFLATIILFLSASCLPAFDIARDGSWTHQTVKAQLAWFDGQWRMTGQQPDTVIPQAGFPQRTSDRFRLLATLKLFNGAGSLKLSETVGMAPRRLRYKASLSSPQKMDNRSNALSFSLPVKTFQGRHIFIDENQVTLSHDAGATYPAFSNAKTIAIPLPDKTVLCITGRLSGVMQDDRNFGGNTYTIRIFGERQETAGTCVAWDVSCSIAKALSRHIPQKQPSDAHTPHLKRNPTTQPVDISACVNMGWQDQVPGDRKGGWTDQGDNDVRTIVPGILKTHGVTFNLIDPQVNDGRSAMVFAGPDRDYFLKQAILPELNEKAQTLYLLHAISWAPEDVKTIGNITVTYDDDSTQTIPVKSNWDVYNWWGRLKGKNALPAWQGRNSQSEVTLYLSGFQLHESKTLRTLQFQPTGAAVWMVAAVTLGDCVPAILPSKTTRIVAGKDWRPFHNTFDITPGSALDWSYLNHTPAGKYGWTRPVGPNLEFQRLPGQAQRFYGTNLCWAANFLPHAQAAEIPHRLAAMGFNSVRIHHYDLTLTERMPDKADLDPERLDQLDYLIAQCKLAGIYVTFDLYTYRLPYQGKIAGIRIKDLHDFRAALPVVPQVEQDFKNFARKILTHKNPYTGLEWRDDPAIFAICTVNENLMPAPWKGHPQLPQIYRRKFQEWCNLKKITMPEPFDDSRDFKQFILEMQQESWKRISTYLRRNLNVKAMLTDNNNGESLSQTSERSLLDYVDYHGYWEHPVFLEKPWQLPHYYKQESAIVNLAAVPRTAMPCRILGKPFFITEFDYGFPNHYRSEGGLLMGAYAGFQNWSALYRFAYSHFDTKMFQETTADMFDTCREPINMMADRMAAWLFRQFHVKTATTTLPFLFTQHDYPGYADYPPEYSKLGLIMGIGSVDARNLTRTPNCAATQLTHSKPNNNTQTLCAATPDFLKQCAQKKLIDQPKNNCFVSQTGELTLNRTQQSFTMITPKSEGFALPAGLHAQGKEMTVSDASGFTTLLLTSADGKDLQHATRLLLFFLTDAMNSGITFKDRQQTILESWGTLPFLLRRGTATVTINCHPNETELHVYPLNQAGSRLGTVTAKRHGKQWRLNLDNTAFKEPVFAYEIHRQ